MRRSIDEGWPPGRPLSWAALVATLAVCVLWAGLLARVPASLASAVSDAPKALAASGEAWLELHFRLVASNELGIRRVTLRPDWAGASRHFSRDAGWRRIPLGRSVLRLEADAPASPRQRVAAGRIRAGRYDRVLISTPLVEVEYADGRTAPAVSHIEPIARGFEIAPGESLAIEIDLILREAASNPMNQPEIFVMDARLIEDREGAASDSPATP